MSLIGSLEDLSLGDILQIISLSRKSGVLVLRTEEGEGRIVFRSGLVSAAATKGGPCDLRGILVAGGFLDAEAFDAAESEAAESSRNLGESLVAAGFVTAERLDSLRRESVESAVIDMFRWTTGDFSFDVREGEDPEDPQIILEVGVNPQYLAMEAARCADETERSGEAVEEAGTDEPSALEMFGVEPDEIDESAASENPVAEDVVPDPGDEFASDEESRRLAVAALADAALRSSAPSELDTPEAATLELVDTVDEGDTSPGVDRSDDATLPDLEIGASMELAEADTTGDPDAEDAPATLGLDPSRPVVVIDAELAALEWTKAALVDTFERVHIFQRADLGLTRIRQYLARAVAPIVLIAPDTPGDRLSGIRDSSDFVRRLKHQVARTHVVWLQEDGARPLESVAPADAIATRPASHHLQNAAGNAHVASLSNQLVRLLCEVGTGEAPPRAVPAQGRDLESLKLATEHLRDASTRGEVLPLVIEFAARSFRRVAMLMIRDGSAFGIAQRGLELCGGPGDDALREVSVRVEESPMLAAVLSERSSRTGEPTSDGDEALALALGDRLPRNFYLAPIESGGSVVAVVYGDDLPGDASPGDTSALEVVLHHAGLALDRASLERALAEAESESAGESAGDSPLSD